MSMMEATELQEIKDYWESKYPHVDIRLWSNEDRTKHYGHMLMHSSNINFEADTVGQLISLGEEFLRKNK
jgi:hypothetical protein